MCRIISRVLPAGATPLQCQCRLRCQRRDRAQRLLGHLTQRRRVRSRPILARPRGRLRKRLTPRQLVSMQRNRVPLLRRRSLLYLPQLRRGTVHQSLHKKYLTHGPRHLLEYLARPRHRQKTRNLQGEAPSRIKPLVVPWLRRIPTLRHLAALLGRELPLHPAHPWL
jgi:hypothetical protein